MIKSKSYHSSTVISSSTNNSNSNSINNNNNNNATEVGTSTTTTTTTTNNNNNNNNNHHPNTNNYNNMSHVFSSPSLYYNNNNNVAVVCKQRPTAVATLSSSSSSSSPTSSSTTSSPTDVLASSSWSSTASSTSSSSSSTSTSTLLPTTTTTTTGTTTTSEGTTRKPYQQQQQQQKSPFYSLFPTCTSSKSLVFGTLILTIGMSLFFILYGTVVDNSTIPTHHHLSVIISSSDINSHNNTTKMMDDNAVVDDGIDTNNNNLRGTGRSDIIRDDQETVVVSSVLNPTNDTITSNSTNSNPLMIVSDQSQIQVDDEEDNEEGLEQPSQQQQQQQQQQKRTRQPPIVVYGNDRLLANGKSINTTRHFQPSSYAYAFLIGGVNPKNHIGYRGFIYNVLVATNILHEHYNCDNDIWLMVQMVQHQSDGEGEQQTDQQEQEQNQLELPDEDIQLLQNSNIHIWYLPSSTSASFAETVFEKFRILQMNEYKRVMFLDADIMPTSNLDYLFHLTDPIMTTTTTSTSTTTTTSTSTTRTLTASTMSTNNNDTDNTTVAPPPLVVQFQPNLIVATRGEACNAGLFILEPTQNGYNDIVSIIHRQHQHAIDTSLSYPFFDKTNGWGHNFISNNDNWDAIVQQGKRWNYHASHSDQGLLYYYTKYYIQKVTIVIGKTIENWEPISDKTLFQQDDLSSTTNYGTGHSLPIKTQTYSSYNDIMPLSLQNGKNQPIYSNPKKGGCTEITSMNADSPPVHGYAKNAMNGQSVPLYNFHCYVPYSNYQHFFGKTKPWQQKSNHIDSYIRTTTEPIRLDNDDTINSYYYYYYTNPYMLWFHTLRTVLKKNKNSVDDNDHTGNDTITGNIDHDTTNIIMNDDDNDNDMFMNWWMNHSDSIKESPLGYLATYKDHSLKVQDFNTNSNTNNNTTNNNNTNNNNDNENDSTTTTTQNQ